MIRSKIVTHSSATPSQGKPLIGTVHAPENSKNICQSIYITGSNEIIDPVMPFVIRSLEILDPAYIAPLRSSGPSYAFCYAIQWGLRSCVKSCHGIQMDPRSFPGIHQHV